MLKNLLIPVSISLLLLQGCAPALVGGAAAGAVMVADDQRTTGVLIDDQGIKVKISNALGKQDSLKDGFHVNVTSFNAVVLLTGEAASEEQRQLAERTAYDSAKIRHVFNEIRLAPVSTLGNRSQDSWITTKVKSQLLAEKGLPSNHMKVVTEAQTVYLLGLVTMAQGERAAEIARHTSKVRRVVKLFEYTGESGS